MNNWFSKNFWLKLIAFVLAVITWFYARHELKNIPGYKAESAIYSEDLPAITPQK
jgi:hypothetical protein